MDRLSGIDFNLAGVGFHEQGLEQSRKFLLFCLASPTPLLTQRTLGHFLTTKAFPDEGHELIMSFGHLLRLFELLIGE
jgi:hypothetical protein